MFCSVKVQKRTLNKILNCTNNLNKIILFKFVEFKEEERFLNKIDELLCTFKVVINAFQEANEYAIYAYVKIKTDYLYKVNIIIRQNSGGKSMKRRLLLMVTMVVMMLSMVGCGSTSQTDNGSSKEETEQSAENKNNEVKTEATTETVTQEPAWKKSTCTAQTSTKKDTDKAIIDELIKNFGTRKVSRGETIDLREYCDWASFSPEFQNELVTSMKNNFELDKEIDEKTPKITSNPSFVFNAADEAELAMDKREGRSNSRALIIYVVE